MNNSFACILTKCRLLALRAAMKHAFFNLHMPYGLQRRRDGKWVVFNRYYAPLGSPVKSDKPDGLLGESGASQQDWTTYDLSEKAVLKVAGDHNAMRNNVGEVERVYFYDKDILPPKTGKGWQNYIAKLLTLSKLTAD